MKKFLAISCIFIFILISSCANQSTSKEIATTNPQQHSSEAINVSTEVSSSVLSSQNSIFENTSTSTKINLNENTTFKSTNDVPPYILTVSLDDLKQIKAATETMADQEFADYMKTNYSNEAVNGMNSLANSKQLLEELEKAYIPVLDGNKAEIPDITFYWERNEFHQMIYFNEESRVVAYISTPERIVKPENYFGYNENAVLVKSIENDLYSAQVYTLDSRDNFFIDLSIDNAYIYLRSHDIETIEELETNIARLEFVKIGDLLA